MITAVRATAPDLADKMQAVQDARDNGRDVGKLFDGTIIKAIVAYIQAHPGECQALIVWLLTTFGVAVPPLPITPPATT